MKICVITRSTPEHAIGGMERVTGELANSWALNGNHVTIITTPSPHNAHPWQWDGVEVLVAPGCSGRYTDSWARAAKSIALANCSDVDVILGVSASAREFLKPPRPTMPIIMQAHGTSFDEIRTKWASPSLGAKAKSIKNIFWLGRDLHDYPAYDQVIGVGPSVERILNRLPKPTRPLRYITIPNGISRKVFARSSGPRKGIVFVGRLHKEKGADLAIRAIAKSNDVLTIIGDGPERSRLDGLVTRLGINGRVRFTGEVGKTDVFKLVSTAEALIAPSRRYEVGLPLTALESLASGTPVVISDKNASALSQELRNLVIPSALSPENLMKAIASAKGHSVYLPERYSLEFSSAEYLRVFNNLLYNQVTSTSDDA